MSEDRGAPHDERNRVPGTPWDVPDILHLVGRLPDLNSSNARDLVHRHLGPAHAERLDNLAREAGRAEVPPFGSP